MPATLSGSYLHLGGIGVAADLNGKRKLRCEDRQCAQLAREHVVKERPQLCKPVLDGGSTHDDAMHCLKLFGRQSDLCIGVAHFVALI